MGAEKETGRTGIPIMRLINLAVLVSLALVQPCVLRAEVPPAGDTFTFKRVKPPAAGARRITVQIDPAEQARRLAAFPDVRERTEATTLDPVTKPDGAGAAPGAAPVAPPKTDYAWFWDKVPTTLKDRDGRFALALAALSQGPGGVSVRAPRLQAMQEIAGKYGTAILTATIGTEVSPALVLAVIGIESAGRPDAISSAGATGLMQLIPATATRFGVSDAADAVQNIQGGIAYLDWLMKRFDRDPLMVLAAYNAGEGAVEANAGVPPYPETRDYVPKVLAAWQVAQGLCLTPPELVTDPCVFKIISASN
jgi:soluble lytic murein transglycosylase-like protein